MKDITIHYNNESEYKQRGTLISIFLDDTLLENWQSFSIDIKNPDGTPIYTVTQAMDYPTDEDYMW